LAETVRQFRDSPLFGRIQQSPLARQWLAGKEFAKLDRLRAGLEQLTATPLPKLLHDLFGEAVVLAIYLPETGEPAGVLLTHVAEPAVVDRVLSALQRAEPQRETVTLTHAGQTYFRQTRPASGERAAEVLYFVRLERILALTDKEPLIRRILERRQHPETTLPESAAFQTARDSLTDEPAAWAYLNPRAWDRVWQQADAAPPLPFGIWQRCRGVIAGLHVQEGAVLELLVQYEPGTAAGTAATEAGSLGQQFLENVPQSAVMALALNVPPALLGQALQKAVAQKNRADFEKFRRVLRGLLLGQDLFDEVLPALGASWGGYVLLEPEPATGRFPATGVLEFSFAAGEPDAGPATVHAALENALRFAWNLWATIHNSRPRGGLAVVRTQSDADRPLRWIDRLGGFQPTFALTRDQLILATSPEVLLKEPAREPRLVEDRAFQQWRTHWFDAEPQLAFVNLQRLRWFVDEHQEDLVRQMSRHSAADSEPLRQRVQSLRGLLGLLDAVFLAGGLHESHARLVLGGVLATD
jgi:hypothetical protein